ERVLGEGLVEDELTTDRGHANRISVTSDAGYDSFGDPPAVRIVERPEPQRVHEGDGPGAHREDVAQDAARPGRGTLVWLDRRRMVVALDADGGGDAIADVDDAGILARTDEHTRPFARQARQVHARRFVRAVLRPHDGEHRQFQVGGRATEQAFDVGRLVV